MSHQKCQLYGNIFLHEFEKNSILVVGSIYGIEILEDNASSARERLYRGFKKQYESCFKNSLNDELLRSVKFILKKTASEAITIVRVTVSDINDNSPMFIEPTYTFVVSEDTPLHTVCNFFLNLSVYF